MLIVLNLLGYQNVIPKSNKCLPPLMKAAMDDLMMVGIALREVPGPKGLGATNARSCKALELGSVK